ncbi:MULTISPECIES: hypothetical protein [unclassified Haladaptatus]|uniref:hypothetical protein n=1 Tax=unclassified Haladaptatus TaxID=2622732 RepID=UPI0023E81E8D|nr:MULTISPECIES: hypothetical protein [unclassified Haladaptatus]
MKLGEYGWFVCSTIVRWAEDVARAVALKTAEMVVFSHVIAEPALEDGVAPFTPSPAEDSEFGLDVLDRFESE